MSASGISSASAPALDVPARFFALGMAGLVTVAALAPWGVARLILGFGDRRALAFVHLNTLGVVAAVILGASYQLVPVVLQTPLASERLARLSFWLYLGGVGLFLPGLLTLWLPALAGGSTLLLSAFALYAGVLGWTLRRAPRRDVVAWHVAAALVSLVGGVVLGVALAFNEGMGFLGGLTFRLLAAHVTLMLAGWVAVLLAGVAYRLVGMFTLAEDALDRRSAWLSLGLSSGGAWVLAASLALDAGRTASVAGAALIAAGQLGFAGQLARLYRHRRRRGFDVHAPFAQTAAAFGVVAAVTLVAGLTLGRPDDPRWWLAAGWLAIAGLAETAIQGFFYKIATFLVWLHRYAPEAGRRPVPRLEALYRRRPAVAGWGLWTGGLALSLAAIVFGSATLGAIAGLAMSGAVGCFLSNVLAIAGHWRPIRVGLVQLGTRAR